MSKVHYLVLCAMLPGFINADDRWTQWQLNLTQSHYETVVNVSDSSGEEFGLLGGLRAHGIEAYSVFSTYASFGTGVYSIHSCIEGSQEAPLACQLSESIHGAHISFLVGHNLAHDGVYLYTGARYYWEWNDQASFSSFVIPAGIGFRLMDVSLDISTELREVEQDFDVFGIFSVDDASGYSLTSDEGDVTVDALPFKLTLGYQF